MFHPIDLFGAGDSTKNLPRAALALAEEQRSSGKNWPLAAEFALGEQVY